MRIESVISVSLGVLSSLVNCDEAKPETIYLPYSETEDGDENYQTTYLEWGGRSDHLDDAINNLTGREVEKRSVRDCSESERRYVASVERNTKDDKDAKAAPAAA